MPRSRGRRAAPAPAAPAAVEGRFKKIAKNGYVQFGVATATYAVVGLATGSDPITAMQVVGATGTAAAVVGGVVAVGKGLKMAYDNATVENIKAAPYAVAVKAPKAVWTGLAGGASYLWSKCPQIRAQAAAPAPAPVADAAPAPRRRGSRRIK